MNIYMNSDRSSNPSEFKSTLIPAFNDFGEVFLDENICLDYLIDINVFNKTACRIRLRESSFLMS